MNFNKGDPTLLSFEDARTLFHEMGHGLHGLLSNVTYPTVSCTSVLTDWVELPSQLYEHWFEQPEVLRKFARHYKTGEPIPEALVQKLMAAKNFDRGCQTLEYISSALVDLDLHLLTSAEGLDVNAFERADARAHRHARGDRDAAPAAAFHPRVLRRLLRLGLLQLHVVGGARRRRLRGVRGDRRHLQSGDRAQALSERALDRRLARSGRALRRVPRPDADRRRAVEEARLRSTPARPHDRAAHRRPSPRRRLRAARGGGRGRPRHPGRGRQRARSHGGDGGEHRRRLSAHEPHRRRRLLARPRAEQARPRDHGGGTGRLARHAGALPPARDDPLARAARRADRAGRGRRLDAGDRGGAGGRRQGIAARRAAARGDRPGARRLCRRQEPGAADDGKACRVEGRPGLRRDIPARRQAAGGRHEAQAERARLHARSSGAQRASRISIAAMSAARSPPTWKRSAAR